MKEKIYNFLESNTVSKFLIFLILANLIIFIFDTDVNLHNKYSKAIYIFEIFSVGIFSIEYIFRLTIFSINNKQ